MKTITMPSILIVQIILIISACHSHDHPADSNDKEESQYQTQLITERTHRAELFADYKPLVSNRENSILFHITELDEHDPLRAESVELKLMNGDDILLTHELNTFEIPGLYPAKFTPNKGGIFDMQLIYSSEGLLDTFNMNGIKVYASEQESFEDNPTQAETDEIEFFKEQAWKTDFKVSKVERKEIRDVIRTSGEIRAAKAAEKIVSATSNGIVTYANPKLQLGTALKKGEVLFSIKSNELINNNQREAYLKAKASYDKAGSDLERAESLLEKQIIGKKEYAKRQMDFSIAEAELNKFRNQGLDQKIKASISGFLKQSFVKDGQYVEEGDALIEITNNRKLLLHTEIAQNKLKEINSLSTANFKTAYQEEIQSLEKYNGKLLSYSKVLEPGKHFLPIWFELDNINELIPGSFVDLYLLTSPLLDQIVIPKTALLQDYNNKFVYVQNSGEKYEKREVRTGIDDGVNIQILSGLTENDWIVTKGAYQLKMASMASSVPAHSHTH